MLGIVKICAIIRSEDNRVKDGLCFGIVSNSVRDSSLNHRAYSQLEDFKCRWRHGDNPNCRLSEEPDVFAQEALTYEELVLIPGYWAVFSSCDKEWWCCSNPCLLYSEACEDLLISSWLLWSWEMIVKTEHIRHVALIHVSPQEPVLLLYGKLSLLEARMSSVKNSPALPWPLKIGSA